MRARLLALLAAGLLALPAIAGPYEDGLDAYEKGDYANAERLFKIAVEQGNAGAAIQLGLQYAFGRGVERNYEEALKLYLLAAAQGEVQAMSLAGVMYERGAGVEVDLVKALMWYTLAAEKDEEREIDRVGLEPKLTRPDQAKARDIAAACKRANFKNC
jgi:TPR repeat protein